MTISLLSPPFFLQCWGYNEKGQLGLGDNETRGGLNEFAEMGENLPAVDVGTGEAIVAMGLGASHTCAVLDGGALKVIRRGYACPRGRVLFVVISVRVCARGPFVLQASEAINHCVYLPTAPKK